MDMIRTFFPLGPPPRAEKPLDPALEYRISKLAEYAAANGPPFVEEVRQKQATNPDFAFLFNNDQGSAYFAWTLYTILNGKRTQPPIASPPSTRQDLPRQPPPSTAPPPLHHRQQQQQQQQPYDPFSFPPGLLPEILRANTSTHHNPEINTDDIRKPCPYQPIDPKDIERHDIPEPSSSSSLDSIDPYLKAKIDSFYAYVQDYRPGITFGDIKIDNQQQQHGYAASERGGGDCRKGASPWGGGGSGGGGDGSHVSQRAGGGNKGLGYGNSGAEDIDNGTDMYRAYRTMRSSGYHSSASRTVR